MNKNLTIKTVSTCILLTLALTLALVGPGCNLKAPGAAPTLPPAASMSLDFGKLDASGGQAPALAEGSLRLAPALAPAASSNYETAVGTLGLINLLVYAKLAPPVAVFLQAFSQTPELEGDGWYHWHYAKKVGLVQYSADLRGKVEGTAVNWEMRVTGGDLDDFLWYTGITDQTNKQGTWTFYDPEAAPGVAVATIAWTNQEADKSLVITVTNPANEAVGDTLTYALAGTAASVAYADASNGNTASISWDNVTSAGRITLVLDGVTTIKAWDADHNDIES